MPNDVRITGINQLILNMEGAPRVMRDRLPKAMEKALKLVVGTARGLAPRDEGTTADSIDYSVHGAGSDTVTGEAGPRNGIVGLVAEVGRKPGRMPPPESLAGWASRHGFDEDALFVLARAIGEKGTRGKPFMRPAAQRHEAEITDIFAGVGVDLVGAIVQGVEKA